MNEPQRVSIVARASGADLPWLESLAASAGTSVEVIAVLVPEEGSAAPRVGSEDGTTRIVRVPAGPSSQRSAGAIASGVALAQGAWLLLMEPGDRLASDALDRLRAQAQPDALAVLAGVDSVETALAALVADPRALAGSLVRTELVSRPGGLDLAVGDAWELDLWLRLLPSLAGSPVTAAALAERAPAAAAASRERALVLTRALVETRPIDWPLAPTPPRPDASSGVVAGQVDSARGADAPSSRSDEAPPRTAGEAPSSGTAEPRTASTLDADPGVAPAGVDPSVDPSSGPAAVTPPSTRDGAQGVSSADEKPGEATSTAAAPPKLDEAAACRELARLAAGAGAPELLGVAAMLWLRAGAGRTGVPPALASALPGLSSAVVSAPPPPAAGGSPVAAGEADLLRVVLEVRSLDRGGLESVVVDLALGLRREGILPSVVCTERGGTEVERLRSAGIEVVVLGAADRAAELAGWLDARDVDLWNPHYSDLGTPLAAARGIPVVVTLHNEYAWVPNRRGDPFRVLDPSVAAYVAVSASAAEFCAARFGLAPERIRVIRNALSRAGSRRSALDRLAARVELDIPADAELLLQVGRVDAIKAPLALVEAVAVLAAERPRLCAWIVGPLADRDYAERLRARIDELGLTDRIFVAGRRGDVPRLLAAADVFVLPSWIEGLSLAVVEALAAGVPAVLSRTGDAGFLLGEGAVGSEGVLPGALVARSAIHPVTITPEKFHELVWTCGPAQGAPLAAAITAVLEDLPVRREAARRRAAELAPLLAADRMLRDYATLFRDVVRDRAPLGLELLDRSIAAARSRYQAAHGGAAMLRVASRALFGAEAALVRERSRADANAAAVAELSGVVERTSSALAPVGEKLERALGKLGLGSRLRALFRPATGRSEDRSR